MKLKLDANGNVVTQEVNGVKCPVYVHDDGKEFAHDAAATVAKINQLNGESRDNRVRAETAEGKLAAFADITDPAEALKAIQVVKNLDAKKLVDAGEIEKVRNEAIASVEAKYKPFVEENAKLKDGIFSEKLTNAFANSPFVKTKIAENVAPDLLQARFGTAFKMGDTGLYAVNERGEKIYSKSRHGEVANFDEALEVLVEGHPAKDGLLRGSGASGAGTGGGRMKPGAGGKRQLTRTEFDSLDAKAKADAMSGGNVEVVDG